MSRDERIGVRLRTLARKAYPEPHLFVTLMFLVFVLARYMQWAARREIFATIRFEFLVGSFLTVVCVVALSASERRPLGGREVMTGIALLFLAMLLQLPFAADPEAARTVFVDRVIKFAMLTLFIATLVRSPRGTAWFLAAFILACFYVTLESARGAISGGLVWENQGVMRLHGAVPIYSHPNSLGGLAMGLIPFCVFLFPVVRNRWLRLMLLPPLMTSSICILYSGSRTAYVAFFAFLLFWLSQSGRKLVWLLVAVAIAVAAYPLIPDQYVERFKSINGQEAEGHSKAARIQILDDAWRIFLAHPTGVGVASFQKVRRETFGRKQDTHNLYLEVATNLGIQGLIVFLFLVYAMIRNLRRARTRFRSEARRLKSTLRSVAAPPPLRRDALEHIGRMEFLAAVCTAVYGFIFVRLILGLFGMDLYEIYWWFAAGMAITLLDLAIRARGVGGRLEEQFQAAAEESP